jgi:hypothetical protein
MMPLGLTGTAKFAGFLFDLPPARRHRCVCARAPFDPFFWAEIFPARAGSRPLRVVAKQAILAAFSARSAALAEQRSWWSSSIGAWKGAKLPLLTRESFKLLPTLEARIAYFHSTSITLPMKYHNSKMEVE